MPAVTQHQSIFTFANALSALRLALLPVFIALLIEGSAHREAALVVLFVMAITDLADGPLARRLNQVSRLGTFLDPTADKLLVNATMLLLAIPSIAPAGFRITPALVVGAYLKDAGVLIGAAVVIWKNGKVGIAAAKHGKISTAAQLILIFVTLTGPLLLQLSSNMAGVLFWLAQWLTLLATAYAAAGYSIEGARQIRQFEGVLMTPKPSQELRDIAPAAVPDELMKKMHEANQHLDEDREALEAATTDGDYDQSAIVEHATERLRKTEHEIEDVESKVRDAIHPPAAPNPKP